MFKPFVSVIIPVYNVENYFPRCMKSVIAQTYSNYEVVLIDDGSTDDSGNMCDKYSAEYDNIRVIHQNNQGLSAARNNGVSVARGDYICFVDSDDYISIDYIEKMVTAIELYKADIAVIKICSISDQTVIPVEYKDDYIEYQLMDTQTALEKMLYGRLFGVSACAKLYRKETVEKYLYPVGVYYEDLGVTYKIIGECSKVIYVDSAAYFYVKRKGSIRHSHWQEKHLYGVEAAKQELIFVEKRYSDIVNAAKCRYILILLDYMELLREHSKEDRKRFKLFRKEMLVYAGEVLKDRNVTQNTKIKIGIVSMGYLPMCIAWQLIELIKDR